MGWRVTEWHKILLYDLFSQWCNLAPWSKRFLGFVHCLNVLTISAKLLKNQFWGDMNSWWTNRRIGIKGKINWSLCGGGRVGGDIAIYNFIFLSAHYFCHYSTACASIPHTKILTYIPIFYIANYNKNQHEKLPCAPLPLHLQGKGWRYYLFTKTDTARIAVVWTMLEILHNISTDPDKTDS